MEAGEGEMEVGEDKGDCPPYDGPTKQCPMCHGRGTWWTDCGDSTCDCDGSTYDCSQCNKTGQVPDYQAGWAVVRQALGNLVAAINAELRHEATYSGLVQLALHEAHEATSHNDSQEGER